MEISVSMLSLLKKMLMNRSKEREEVKKSERGSE